MIISGKELANKLKTQMAEFVATLPEKYGRVPHLVVILVDHREIKENMNKLEGKIIFDTRHICSMEGVYHL